MGAPETFGGMIERLVSAYMACEVALAVLIVLLAWRAPGLGSRAFERIERWACGMASTPGRQILAVGLLAVLARGLLLPWLGSPVASVHDEQSLLLQAQTYLAGRLANPTPPFWQHYETFHVNMVPAYGSVYFPGRGAPLAAGLLLGDPWWGVWISFVLMCMAAVWMLQAWVPAPYALLGGVLVVIRFGVFSYWINSYWGGAFTALGGMLVIGALPRILRRPTWTLGLVMGTGVAIMATTRTYEALLLSVAVAVVLLAKLVRPPWQGGRAAFLKVAVPGVVLVAASGGLLLAYNQATTGQALQTPYEVNRAAYADAPAFLTAKPFQSEQRGPAYFRDFYLAEGQNYLRRYSPARVAGSLLGKLFHTWNFYVGPTLTLAFAAGLWAARRQPIVLGCLAFFLAGYALETWNFPHYTAPLFPLILVILMQGFHWMRSAGQGRPSAALVFLTRAMPAAGLAVLLLPLSAVLLGVPRIEPNLTNEACCALPHDDVRRKVIARVGAPPARALVMVNDGPGNPLHYEMVYNEPDLDKAAVVWARRLGDRTDAQLLDHFADRVAWEFEWRPDLPEKFILRPLRAPQDARITPRAAP